MIEKNNDMLSDVIHYYEVRMSALSEYSDRVWNRFNWFLTLCWFSGNWSIPVSK